MRNFKILPQIFIAIAASFGTFLYGITLGWSAPSQIIILSAENHFQMTTNEFSWATAMMPLGAAISCVASGLVRNKLGTKLTILIFAIPHLAGWLLLIFSWRPLMIILGRMLIGTAGGAYSFNIPVFIGEIASKEIRGLLVTFVQVALESGILFVYTLGTLVNLTVLNIVCASLMILYTVVFLFLPETPVYLVRKNKLEEAEKSLKLLRGESYDTRAEIEEMKKNLDEEAKIPKCSFLQEMKKTETFKAFIIILFVFMFFQMSGINAVTFYTTMIFKDAGITDVTPSTATVVIGLVMVVCTISTAGCIDRFGRVFLLILSFIMMIAGLIVIGCFFMLNENFGGLNWLPLPALCIFVVGFSIGIGPVPIVLLGELFSNDAKKIVAPFAQTLSFLMSFGVGVTYPALAETIGNGPTFFIFTGFCIAGLLFTIFVVPETKGKSLPEIQQILRDAKIGNKKRKITISKL